MGYLLDTHILLWAAAGHPRLTGKARAILEDDDLPLWFSAASIWEVAIKRALDRPDFRTDPGLLRGGLLTNGYRELPVDGRHCLPVATLPPLHADPFDRLLIATALTEGLTLVTADARVAQYAGPIEMV